jgi:hypothetical protein
VAVLIPPVLEIYVLWHPDDADGPRIAEVLLSHFHGTTFSGLVGGAVEVYTRSAGWDADGGAPRPMPFMEPLPNGLTQSAVTAVVPVLGTRLARAVDDDPAWRRYLEAMLAAADSAPTVGVFALKLDNAALAGTTLADLFGAQQGLDAGGAADDAVLCRDLAHSIGGLIGDPMGERLRVFISHTKRYSPDEEPDAVHELVHLIRDVIGNTHLTEFFDQADLLPSVDWERELTEAAGSSGLLAVRTDLYASRDWCQREVLVAKRADMPVVVLQALHRGEERGSFLMDHVPAVPLHRGTVKAQRASIEAALNQLVDEALKRALWKQQRGRLASLGFDWLPANAPEPTTLIGWLASIEGPPTADDRLFVLHPDPPLGNAEWAVIGDLLKVAGMPHLIDILTPRTFASRGGQVTP